MSQTPEHELIARCRQGDETAFRELIDQYKGMVFGLTSRSATTRERAEDLAQEVFLRVHRGLPYFRGEAKLSTWLYAITSRLCLNRLASGERRLVRHGEETLLRLSDDRRRPDAALERSELESALARLRTAGRVVVLHYSPVSDTCDGEPFEIYPFLGSSRMEEPVNRYAASVVFHGHAHAGRPEGKTSGGVPVYNVALPLLQRLYPDQPPFRVVEIPAQPATPAAAGRGDAQ